MLPMLVTPRYNFRVIITKYISSPFRNARKGEKQLSGGSWSGSGLCRQESAKTEDTNAGNFSTIVRRGWPL
jgi:hypothetical protein